jgi:hypothetical protein
VGPQPALITAGRVKALLHVFYSFRRCLARERKYVLPVGKVRAVTSGVQNLLQLSPQRELGFPTAVPIFVRQKAGWSTEPGPAATPGYGEWN